MRQYFLLIILIPYLSISQANINIKVNYKPVISINLDTVQGPSNFKKSFKNSIDKSELLSFNLAINSKDSLSVYERNELLDTSINKLDLNLINLIIDGEGKYFFSNGKLIHDYNVLDKNLKVEIAKNIDWILINEKKNIGNYVCLKAIGTVEYGKYKGDKVEAWYAISIPLPYDPKMYRGLPGLILEVKETNSVLYADKIEFQEKNISIKSPKEEKRISEKEADSILVIMNKKAEGYFKN